MIKNIQFNNVTVVGNGSQYNTNSGKIAYAFYYEVNGVRQSRKVITAKDEEELEQRVTAFLQKKNDEVTEVAKAVELVEESNSVTPFAISVRKTYAEVGDEWLDDYLEKHANRSFSTRESRKYSLIALKKKVGEMFIDEISNDNVEIIMAKCFVKEDGIGYYSKSHVDKLQQVFRLVLEYGREKRYCSNYVDKVELPDEIEDADREERFLDRDELDKIFKALSENRRYYTLVKLLVASGLRQEEAFALKVDDFKKLYNKEGEIKGIEIKVYKTLVETSANKYEIVYKVKTKNSKRCVPIDIDTYNLVMDYYNECLKEEGEWGLEQRAKNNTEGYIFLNQYMLPHNKRTFERNFQDYLERRGIPGVTLHMFRHSYASIMAEKVGFHELARLLGDNPITVYNKYYSMTEKKKHDVSEHVSDYMSEFNF